MSDLTDWHVALDILGSAVLRKLVAAESLRRAEKEDSSAVQAWKDAREALELIERALQEEVT